MADSHDNWHREILTDAQGLALAASQTILRDVAQAFLAGRTALALRYGHRRSRDLDWFTTATFDHVAVAERLGCMPSTTVTLAEPGTIHAECHGIALSLIRYPVGPPDCCDAIPLAPVRTAGGMKLLAIINRGYKRDFIDVAEMLSHGIDLSQLIHWAVEDIPGLTLESALRALAWRTDAETQPHPDGIDTAAWQTAQLDIDQAISRLVKNY
jgi:hypothetical protein